MRRYSTPMLAVAVVVLGAAFAATRAPAGDEPPAAGAKGDPAFTGKVVYAVARPRDAKGDDGYGFFEATRVVKLGDRYFLTGRFPDFGIDEPGMKEAVGKTMWMPVSEVVQMTEFATVAEAKHFLESRAKAEN